MKAQHPSWQGIVPCFESGREYLDWCKRFIDIWDQFDPKFANYFLEIRGAINRYNYDTPIEEKVMCAALERSQATGEMIEIVPNDEYLPGGEREGQYDGWEYHIEFLPMEEYFKKQQEELELQDARYFIDRAEWHFAKTMPQIPHWYCLLKEYDDKEEFTWFAKYIVEHSTPGQFYGKTYNYFFLDGYKYWIMDERPEDCDLINRDKVE